ncbi:unnamed protein product [Acanthoscelides obtectus]|uniref:Uncharacterized protein n=1 Tax=Acanthoscelides obtectus TaxID=200917 RepID=A0A9P0JSC9_ACAOB|nr:unnamed protein product [Acanthoscelides obtectus]CAK1663773.1 hypothetical protein AOBTE_LOCUS23846 [Acanthoscelides obtectus]
MFKKSFDGVKLATSTSSASQVLAESSKQCLTKIVVPRYKWGETWTIDNRRAAIEMQHAFWVTIK